MTLSIPRYNYFAKAFSRLSRVLVDMLFIGYSYSYSIADILSEQKYRAFHEDVIAILLGKRCSL